MAWRDSVRSVATRPRRQNAARLLDRGLHGEAFTLELVANARLDLTLVSLGGGMCAGVCRGVVQTLGAL